MICSIFKCYLDQYVTIYNNLFEDENIDKIILSGGIPKKLSFVIDYFKINIKKEIVLGNGNDDDSVNGLLSYINLHFANNFIK